MSDKIKINGRTIYYGRFTSLETARNCANRTAAYSVMMGNAGQYWVARMVDCERMNKAGYEWA